MLWGRTLEVIRLMWLNPFGINPDPPHPLNPLLPSSSPNSPFPCQKPNPPAFTACKMPPRAAKKSPAKKSPSPAKPKKPVSSPESSPADVLPTVNEETIPEPEDLVTLGDKEESETDVVSGVAPAEGQASPSPAVVEEPTDPIGEDSITQSEPEISLKDEGAEIPLKDDGAELEDDKAVEKMEVDEGVKETADHVNSRTEAECEITDTNDARDADNNGEDNEVNEEDDRTLDMDCALAEEKKLKEFEIFVGGLDKGVVEDDLIEVFNAFGEIQSARIVRNPKTNKSKGFAFVCFANSEHTTKALSELKDGMEIKGKRVRIDACQDNTILHLGNILKTWTRDTVIEKLKAIGVEQVYNITLPEDPKKEGEIIGFAFLEFNSHSDALFAYQCLRKPDVNFGQNKAAKVSFSRASLHRKEDDVLQVKTAYLAGIPLSWDEEKVREICKEYGQIERVLLSQNFSMRKRKDFGFVEFSSRESALACIEGINKAQIAADGDCKIAAELARPRKGRFAKQSSNGGFEAKKDKETIREAGGSVKKRRVKSKKILQVEIKQGADIADAEIKQDANIAEGSKPSTFERSDSKGDSAQKTITPIKRKKSSGKAMNADVTRRPVKKMRPNNGNAHKRRFDGFDDRRRMSYGERRSAFPSRYSATAESQLHPSDLAPHAGYLPSSKRDANIYEHDSRRSGAYSSGSGRERSGVPASYPPRYSTNQRAGYRHESIDAYAPRGPYYY